jgi:hypothetical protein
VSSKWGLQECKLSWIPLVSVTSRSVSVHGRCCNELQHQLNGFNFVHDVGMVQENRIWLLLQQYKHLVVSLTIFYLHCCELYHFHSSRDWILILVCERSESILNTNWKELEQLLNSLPTSKIDSFVLKVENQI